MKVKEWYSISDIPKPKTYAEGLYGYNNLKHRRHSHFILYIRSLLGLKNRDTNTPLEEP